MHLRFSESITVSVLIATVFVPSACHRGKPTNEKRAEVLTVETIAIAPRSAATTIDTAGVLAPWQEVSIGPEVAGYRISEIFVDVGSNVTKGQVLAKLDETLLRSEVEQRSAALSEAEASLEEAKAYAERTAALLKRGAISEQDAVQRRTAQTGAAARVASARAQLDTAEQRLKYATIVAPDFGIISARSVNVGQLAAAGAEFFKLIRQNRIEWRAEIPEAQIASVRAGMTAKVRRPDGTQAVGHVRTVAPSLDSSTRRGIAYIDLKLDAGTRAGMFATGSIELGSGTANMLPLAAVSVRDGFSYVFVVDKDGKVTQRRVEVGRFFKDGVEILSGIAATDAVVSQGAGFLRDGDQVRVTRGALASN